MKIVVVVVVVVAVIVVVVVLVVRVETRSAAAGDHWLRQSATASFGDEEEKRPETAERGVQRLVGLQARTYEQMQESWRATWARRRLYVS